MLNNGSPYGNFRNLKFSDVFETAEDFLAEYKDSGVYITSNKIGDDICKTLFYLLYSNYGNSTIASSDVNQFKYQVFTTIFEYGPSWEKKLDLQSKLRGLTDEQIMQGGKAIYNRALNPGQTPSTAALEELTYINEQNTTNYKKSALEGYSIIIDLISTDVTKEFINKFKKYFLSIVYPEYPLYYVTEDEE